MAESGKLRREQSVFSRLADWIFGYDFFISYAWTDGRGYALDLDRQLSEDGFQCFLDSKNYAIGDDLHDQGARSLRRSSCLILIGTEGALRSEAVLYELRVFSQLDRRVVPISFGGSLRNRDEQLGVFEYVDSNKLVIQDRIESLQLGASSDVVKKIKDSFDRVRQNVKRTRWLTVASIVFALLAACAIIFGILSEHRKGEVEKTLSISDYRQGVFYSDTNRQHALAHLARSTRIDPTNTTAGRKILYLLAEGGYFIHEPVGAPPSKADSSETGVLTWVYNYQKSTKPWIFDCKDFKVSVGPKQVTLRNRSDEFEEYKSNSGQINIACLSADRTVLVTGGGYAGEFGAYGDFQVFIFDRHGEKDFRLQFDELFTSPIRWIALDDEGQYLVVESSRIRRIYRVLKDDVSPALEICWHEVLVEDSEEPVSDEDKIGFDELSGVYRARFDFSDLGREMILEPLWLLGEEYGGRSHFNEGMYSKDSQYLLLKNEDQELLIDTADGSLISDRDAILSPSFFDTKVEIEISGSDSRELELEVSGDDAFRLPLEDYLAIATNPEMSEVLLIDDSGEGVAYSLPYTNNGLESRVIDFIDYSYLDEIVCFSRDKAEYWRLRWAGGGEVEGGFGPRYGPRLSEAIGAFEYVSQPYEAWVSFAVTHRGDRYLKGVPGLQDGAEVQMLKSVDRTVIWKQGVRNRFVDVEFAQEDKIVLSSDSSSGEASGDLAIREAASGDLFARYDAGGDIVVRPDGKRVLSLTEDPGVLAVDLLGDQEPVPLWVADLAEAIGGFRLDAMNRLIRICDVERVALLGAVEKKGELDMSGWGDFLKWYLSLDGTGKVSPYGIMTYDQMNELEKKWVSKLRAP